MKLVMLPGLDGTGILLRPLLQRLSPSIPTEIIPLPDSLPLNSYQALTAYVSERLPTGGPFVVLGESFSGPIAVEIAAANANCRGLILASSFLRRPVWIIPPPLARIAQTPFFTKPGRSLGRLFITSGRSPSEELRQLLDEVHLNVSAPTLCQRARAALCVDARETFRRLEIPILALMSRRDLVVDSRRAARDIHELRPDARLHWFSCSHLVLQNNTAQCAALVEDLFRQIQQPETRLP